METFLKLSSLTWFYTHRPVITFNILQDNLIVKIDDNYQLLLKAADNISVKEKMHCIILKQIKVRFT